jgi:hypothetical protein
MHSNKLPLILKTTSFLSLGSFLFSLLLSPLRSLSNKESITTSLAQSYILTSFPLSLINLALSDSRCSCWKWEGRKNIRLKIRKIGFLQSAIAQQNLVKVHQQPFSFHPSFHEFYEGTQSISPCIHSISEHSFPNSPHLYCVSYDRLQYPI